jgi:hypothetical protein
MPLMSVAMVGVTAMGDGVTILAGIFECVTMLAAGKAVPHIPAGPKQTISEKQRPDADLSGPRAHIIHYQLHRARPVASENDFPSTSTNVKSELDTEERLCRFFALPEWVRAARN